MQKLVGEEAKKLGTIKVIIKDTSRNIPSTYKRVKRETTRSITKEVRTEIIKRKIQATKEISRERKYDRI